MRIRTCIPTLGFVMVAPCFGQNSQSDSQTLQAILNELKQIHEEIRVTETTQILLAELGASRAKSIGHSSASMKHKRDSRRLAYRLDPG